MCTPLLVWWWRSQGERKGKPPGVGTKEGEGQGAMRTQNRVGLEPLSVLGESAVVVCGSCTQREECRDRVLTRWQLEGGCDRQRVNSWQQLPTRLTCCAPLASAPLAWFALPIKRLARVAPLASVPIPRFTLLCCPSTSCPPCAQTASLCPRCGPLLTSCTAAAASGCPSMTLQWPRCRATLCTTRARQRVCGSRTRTDSHTQARCVRGVEAGACACRAVFCPANLHGPGWHSLCQHVPD